MVDRCGIDSSLLAQKVEIFFNRSLMGIHDRDYMKDGKGKSNASGQDHVIRLSEVLIALAKLGVLFVLLILSLRFPLIWIKIPLAMAVLFFGWRWLFRSEKKQGQGTAASIDSKLPEKSVPAERINPRRSNLEAYEAAVGRASKPDHNVVRLLIAYDAAGEFGKAKALIQRMDGQEFSASVGEEFRALAKNYFPIELEPTEAGVRFRLA